MLETTANTVTAVDDTVELNLSDIMWTVRRYWLLLVVLMALAGGSSWYIASRLTPVYNAKSRILIERQPPKIVRVEETVLADYSDRENHFNSQVEILKSRAVAHLVLRALGSYAPFNAAGNGTALTMDQQVDALLRNVSIQAVRQTQVVEISVEDSDAELASRIANLWTNAYSYFALAAQLVQRRNELEHELSQRSNYLREQNPLIAVLQREIDAIDATIANESVLNKSDSDSLSLFTGVSSKNTAVTILDRAVPAKVPVRPRKAVILLLGLLVGLTASVIVVWVLESFDQTLKSIQDMEQAVATTCLCAIPNFRRRGWRRKKIPELISHTDKQSLVAESFRQLRTVISFSRPTWVKKTIMVTSAGAQEGKTTVALNLAVVFAQAGERTLIVDADLRCPRIHQILGLPTAAGGGLSALLAGESGSASYQAYIQPAAISGLSVLSSGGVPANPAELLSAKKFSELIAVLSQDYDRIIFDAPPVLAATDAVILSTRVDVVMFVVRAGYSSRQAVQNSVKALEQVNARILAVVPTMIDSVAGAHYGYSLYPAAARRKHAVKCTVTAS